MIIGGETTNLQDLLKNLSFAQIQNLAGERHKLTFQESECKNSDGIYSYRAHINEIIDGKVIRRSCTISISPYLSKVGQNFEIMLLTEIEIIGN